MKSEGVKSLKNILTVFKRVTKDMKLELKNCLLVYILISREQQFLNCWSCNLLSICAQIIIRNFKFWIFTDYLIIYIKVSVKWLLKKYVRSSIFFLKQTAIKKKKGKHSFHLQMKVFELVTDFTTFNLFSLIAFMMCWDENNMPIGYIEKQWPLGTFFTTIFLFKNNLTQMD